MAYPTGMMNKRVTIARRHESDGTPFGGSTTVTTYEILGTFWAAEDFNRGVKSLREGAYDAYETVMFRMRFNKDIDRWCLIQYQGKWYQIQSFNASHQDNTIQITAVEMANQQVTIYEPPPPVVHEVEIWGDEACTARPSGNPSAVYVKFNAPFGRRDIRYQNDDFSFSVQHIQGPPLTYYSFNDWFWKDNGGWDRITTGTVVQLTIRDGITVDLDQSSDFSFGDVVNPQP